MLDQQNRVAHFLQAVYNVGQVRSFLFVHTGCRFIQQKQLGVRCQCPGNFQLPLGTIGKAGTHLKAEPVEVQQFENFIRFFLALFFFQSLRSGIENGRKDPAFGMAVHTGNYIVTDTHPGIEPDILEGSCKTQLCNFMRLPAGNILTQERHLSFGRAIDAGDYIEQRCFSGTVWADDADDFSAMDFHADVRKGDQATEALGNMFCF